jgi:Ca2+-binding EF-hand superfamily protein
MMKAGLLALMIPAALAAPASAQEAGGEPPRMIFEELDADGNGSVTLEELQGAGEARFAQADTDGDGALNRDELIARGAARIEARVDRMLERMDSDGDGVLTQAEMIEAREGREGRGGRHGRGGPNPERMFERLDADGDGAVTEAEFDEGVARLLERMGRRHGNRGN